jgi:hypothetical protein
MGLYENEQKEDKDEEEHMNVLTKEIESWKGFEYALREENRILFNKMIEECKREGYANAVNTKGKSFAAESLFQVLIFQQQKMISQLIAKLSEYKKYNKTANTYMKIENG